MTKVITIINGHPDPSEERLCHALATAYAAGARDAGHEIHQLSVGELSFPLIHSKTDFSESEIPPDIKTAQTAIEASNHVVIIHPLWLGAMPAKLKGFLEQVFRPSFAFEEKQKGWPKGTLTGKSARIVVTMGMPALAYRWWFGAHSLKILKQHILKFAGMSPVRETVYGMVEEVSEAKRKSWLEEQRKSGTRAD